MACGKAIVCVGPSCTGFFLFSTARLSSTGEKLVLYKLVRAFEHLEEQSAAPI